MLDHDDEEHDDRGGGSPDISIISAIPHVAAAGSLAATVAGGRAGYTFAFAPHQMPLPRFHHLLAPPSQAPNIGYTGMNMFNPFSGDIAGPNSIFQLNGNEKSNGIVYCTLHLPGLPQPFDVPFLSRKLPVCLQCKKNYRSRELCRQRDDHRALPWQTVYVVVTLTEQVLEMGYNGNLRVADIPITAEMQEVPVMCDGPQNKDDFMSKQPICKLCKEKNYTQNRCREILKHTTPPHQAVYVKLIPKTVETEIIVPTEKKKKRKLEENANGVPGSPKFCGGGDVRGEESVAVVDESDKVDDNDKEEEDHSDDMTMGIHQSRTIFANISASKFTVMWCEQIKYPNVTVESSDLSGSSSSNAMMMSSFMNTTNNNNNSMNDQNIQWQLWDAFRAGALWAQAQQQQQYASSQQQLPIPPMVGSPSNNFESTSTGSIDWSVVNGTEEYDL